MDAQMRLANSILESHTFKERQAAEPLAHLGEDVAALAGSVSKDASKERQTVEDLAHLGNDALGSGKPASDMPKNAKPSNHGALRGNGYVAKPAVQLTTIQDAVPRINEDQIRFVLERLSLRGSAWARAHMENVEGFEAWPLHVRRAVQEAEAGAH